MDIDIVGDAEAKGSVDQIDLLVEKLRAAEDLVKSLDEQLLNAKADKNKIQMETLPAAMEEARKKKVEYEDGSVLSIRPYLEASIPSISKINDAEEEERQALVERKNQGLNWLRDNQGSPIIKNQLVVDIPKGADNIVARITALCDELELTWVRGEAVHPMTLKSFLKEKLKAGANIPAEIFGLVVGNKAILKRGK